jgi:hypothetical protein
MHADALPQSSASSTSASQRLLTRTLALFATNDLILLGHLFVMGALTAMAYPAEESLDVARRIVSTTIVLVGACILGRATKLPSRIRSVLYRVAAVATALASYLMLRWTLPLVAPHSFDAQLNAIDLAIFGVEPTLWLEPRMSPAIVEYLAFFYFSYFVLSGLYALVSFGPTSSRQTSAQFAIGTAVVFGIGQLGYVLVPGFGPTHHLASQYAGDLTGGFFWQAVLDTVQAGGAMKDIFPSLHTAGPIWYSLFAWHRAHETSSRRWKALAVVTTIFAAHIVVSTVVLRWHYVIDLAAGTLLATTAFWASKRATRWEQITRDRLGLRPAWGFEP